MVNIQSPQVECQGEGDDIPLTVSRRGTFPVLQLWKRDLAWQQLSQANVRQGQGSAERVLFAAQSDERIQPHCASRREVTCEHLHHHEQDRDRREGKSIGRRDAAEHAGKKVRETQGTPMPVAIPMSVSRNPSPTILFRRSSRRAPSAARIPISWVSWKTRCESTP
jgi:hypothetical protein